MTPLERATEQVDLCTVSVWSVGGEKMILRKEAIARIEVLYSHLDAVIAANNELAERSARDRAAVEAGENEIRMMKLRLDEERGRIVIVDREHRKAQRIVRALTIAIRGGWSLRGSE